MQSLEERGVPQEEHKPASPNPLLGDWQSVRIFLEITRRGSFRSAAEYFGCSVNSLRRRIDEMERDLGLPLLTRHVGGVQVTTEGERILAAAQQMELASFGLVRARDQVAHAFSGEVRVAVTEGLGTFWLAPRLAEFQRAYPGLLIDLHCAMRSADVLRLEADASIQLAPPTAADLKQVKLGRIHVMPFAGRSYADTYGLPANRAELAQHRIVMHASDQTAAREMYRQWFPDVPEIGFVAMRTNVSSANYWAIAKGAGIGWLPTYASAIGARVIPIDIDLRHPFDIWLAYHPDAARVPRIRRVLDWIIESFNPARFPWFRDEFIHPKDLPRKYRGEPLVNMFEGFLGASRD